MTDRSIGDGAATAAATREKWDTLHVERRFRPRYPQDEVVRWTFATLGALGARESVSVLDLGCGGGRHAVFLAREGFRTSALDNSATGVDEARRWAEAEGLAIDFRVGEADALPYADASFDGVLCFGVLCYLDYGRLRAAVGEIHRVLKPGGEALVMTRTDADQRRRHAEAVGPATYVIRDPGGGSGPLGPEHGMLQCFLDEAQVRGAFGGFARLSVDRSTITYDDGAFANDDWLIKAGT